MNSSRSSVNRVLLTHITLIRQVRSLFHQIQSSSKWIYDKEVITDANPEDSLIALGFQNTLVLLDMDNAVELFLSIESQVCFYSGICQRTDDLITSLKFISNNRLIVGTVLGHIYLQCWEVGLIPSLDCALNRIIFYCDMSISSVRQILVFQQVVLSLLFQFQFYWILSDEGVLVRISEEAIQSSIDENAHAYIQWKAPSALPSIVCGSIPQQRYSLQGQRVIHQISIREIQSSFQPLETSPHRRNSTDSQSSSSPSFTTETSFEILAVGGQPVLCSYILSRESVGERAGVLAVSVAKSIYGAVKSLAGYVDLI